MKDSKAASDFPDIKDLEKAWAENDNDENLPVEPAVLAGLGFDPDEIFEDE